jgi:hypothetical protein
MDEEELTGVLVETASITFRFGSSKTTLSLPFPPFCKNPSLLVGIGALVQLQLVQFKSTLIVLSVFPQPFANTSCPDKTKY